MNEHSEENELTQVRAALLEPEMTSVESALAIINERFAHEPLQAEQVHLLPPAELSNMNLDAYFTRMATSSLENYRDDALEGVPLMNSHRRFLPSPELPLGQSYTARLEHDGGNIRLLALFYMLRGLELNGNKTDDVMRAIVGGTLRDVSISFNGGWYRCGICGKELAPRSLLFGGAKGDFCEHVPGVEYDGRMGYAWVENAHLVEGSLVYSGATPGTVLRKAQWAAETGRLSRGDVRLLEDQWNTRIWGSKTYWMGSRGTAVTEHPGSEADGVAEQKGPGMAEREVRTEMAGEMTKEEIVALVEEKAPELMDRIGQADEPVAALLDAWVDARAIKADADKLRETETAQLEERLMQAETELAQMRSSITELEPLAKDGEAYRTELIDQTVAERVRAQGKEFDAEAYRAVLAGQSLDYVRSELCSWEKMAEQVFQPGRPAGEIIGRSQDKESKKDNKTPGKSARAYKA